MKLLLVASALLVLSVMPVVSAGCADAFVANTTVYGGDVLIVAGRCVQGSCDQWGVVGAVNGLASGTVAFVDCTA